MKNENKLLICLRYEQYYLAKNQKVIKGKTKYHTMLNENSAGGVVVNNGKVILVFQNKTQTWALPKGHIDECESSEETARREIYEESGVSDLTFIKKLGTYVRGTKKNPNIKKQITIFHFTTTQNNLQPIDPENPEAKWILKNEVANMLSYEEDKNFFLNIINSL